MQLESTVIISNASCALFDALQAEAKSGLRNDRSSTSIRRDGDRMIITIKASDATAYRAAANSVAKLLITFESMKGINNGR